MKYPVTRFNSMELALKQIEPFVKSGVHLQSGKPFEKLGGMRSREVLANWLLCATSNAIDGRRMTFSSDPTGSDGIVRDEDSGEACPTEHVIVPRQSGGNNADAQVGGRPAKGGGRRLRLRRHTSGREQRKRADFPRAHRPGFRCVGSYGCPIAKPKRCRGGHA